jgi:hypothetical protein
MKTYIIKDWAGNHLFIDKKFESFDDGWEFIYENIDNSLYDKTNNDNDDNYQEYYVIKLK